MLRIGAAVVQSPGRRAFAFAFVLLSAIALSGCGTIDLIKNAIFPPVPKVDIGDIQVFTDPGVNLNTALEFELVFAQDPDVLKKMSELTAAKWFELREDIRKTYPGGFESMKWELVPGQDLRLPNELFKDKRALAVMVFANYLTPGEHRARIDNFREGAVIRLQPRGFTVVSRGDAVQTR
jgi:type VI secretion system protein